MGSRYAARGSFYADTHSFREGSELKYYCEDVRTVLDAVESRSEGLTSAEAAARLEKYGRNKLAEGKKVPVWKLVNRGGPASSALAHDTLLKEGF